MERITITLPKSKSAKELILSLLKELKVKFEISTSSENQQNAELIDKINRGREEIKNGKGTKMSIEELEQFFQE